MSQPNLTLAKKLHTLTWIITVVVLLLVGLMRRVKIPLPEGWDFSFLPGIHALLNTGAALALLAAFYFIKNKKQDLHRKAIYVAMGLSVLFLLSYVTYHFTTPETIYGDLDHNGVLSDAERLAAGSSRSIYMAILLSHIVLAGVSLPLVLLTFTRAYTNQFDRHKRMARWVYWLWLYVAVTGPVCYLMLKPFY